MYEQVLLAETLVHVGERMLVHHGYMPGQEKTPFEVFSLLRGKGLLVVCHGSRQGHISVAPEHLMRLYEAAWDGGYALHLMCCHPLQVRKLLHRLGLTQVQVHGNWHTGSYIQPYLNRRGEVGLRAWDEDTFRNTWTGGRANMSQDDYHRWLRAWVKVR